MTPTQKAKAKYAKSPKGKYASQKAHAKSRGIPFLLTYEEWAGLWDASGKFTEMGRKPDQYCMARLGDSGAYELGNVYITQVSSNIKDQLANGSHAAAKLTSSQVNAIYTKAMDRAGSQTQIANEFGVNQSTVSRIANNLRAKYL